MDSKDILQQGDIGKYQITITRADFSQSADDFSILLDWGFSGRSMEIRKQDTFFDEEGHCFFSFDTSEMLGPVTATCTYFVPDSDEPDSIRREVDRQRICFVSAVPCTMLEGCKCEGDGFVTYKRVLRSDANTVWLTLRDAEQNIIRDEQGQELRVHKSENEINF